MAEPEKTELPVATAVLTEEEHVVSEPDPSASHGDGWFPRDSMMNSPIERAMKINLAHTHAEINATFSALMNGLEIDCRCGTGDCPDHSTFLTGKPWVTVHARQWRPGVIELREVRTREAPRLPIVEAACERLTARTGFQWTAVDARTVEVRRGGAKLCRRQNSSSEAPL